MLISYTKIIEKKVILVTIVGQLITFHLSCNQNKIKETCYSTLNIDNRCLPEHWPCSLGAVLVAVQ